MNQKGTMEPYKQAPQAVISTKVRVGEMCVLVRMCSRVRENVWRVYIYNRVGSSLSHLITH